MNNLSMRCCDQCGREVQLPMIESRKIILERKIEKMQKELSEIKKCEIKNEIEELKIKKYKLKTTKIVGCYICGNNNHLELHHVQPKYSNNELIELFIPLCFDCHRGVHSMYLSDKTLNENTNNLRKLKSRLHKTIDNYFINNMLIEYIEALERIKEKQIETNGGTTDYLEK